MNVPKLRFKEFDGEWKPQKLENFIQFFSGLTYSPDDVLNSGGTLVLRSSNIQSGSIVNADNVYVKSEVVNSENVLKGDIVVVVRNGSRNLIGKHAQVKEDMPDTVIGAFMTGLRSDEPNFLNILLDTKQFQKEIHKNLGATINQITTGAFKRMSFVISDSIGEQKKIGSFFSTIDKKIQLQQEKIDLLKEQKKGYMQKIFSQKLRFKDSDNKIFPEWMSTTIGNCFENYGGTALEKYTRPDGEYKFISIGSYNETGRYNDQNLRIELNEKTRAKLLNKNDLVMVLNDKTTAGNILGRVLLIDENNKYIYNQRSERLICKDIITASYTWYFLNSDFFRKNIISMAQGGTQIYINFSTVSKLKILLPSLNEQRKIVSFLDKLQALIDYEEEKTELLHSQKQAFMLQMFI